jgi:glycosyltransferase involved in cell wall biosynthesis
MAPYKNQIGLALALPILKAASNARVVFAGPIDSTPYFDRVRAAVTAAEAEEDVDITGTLSVDELAQLYALAQVFVITSLHENCPQALLEAMAQGKAILASDIQPLREILPANAALFVPPDDPRALGQALIRLLTDGELRQRLGIRAGRRASESYHWGIVGHEVAAIYGRLVNRAYTPKTMNYAGSLPSDSAKFL